VRLNVGQIGRSSFILDYQIAKVADETLIASGKTVMVSYDYEAAKAVPLPPETRALLEGVRPQSAADPPSA
jgi:acyl-CoA thioesterase FadM